MSQTNEHAFESYCEQMLLTQGGWERGNLAEWDRHLALFPARVCAFLEDSQPVLWQKLHDLHGDALGTRVAAALAKELDLKGMLHVLRRGFKFHGKTLRMAYFKPAHGLNATVVELFGKNPLTVTRQVPCHAKGGETLDMLLALNGLPIGSCELKNPGTGQTWRHAVKQYREDRDPNAPLFQCKARALVHFAVDPDEVHMTTRLLGERTRFLPFNRGSDPGTIRCGAGNPAHPSGYRTGHFWEEVLAREGLLEILGSFMFIERKDGEAGGRQGQGPGTKIVITTLQMFPFVLRGLLRAAGAASVDAPSASAREQADAWKAQIAGRRYAIIVDEAHSSQTGETAREMKAILGAGSGLSDLEGEALPAAAEDEPDGTLANDRHDGLVAGPMPGQDAPAPASDWQDGYEHAAERRSLVPGGLRP